MNEEIPLASNLRARGFRLTPQRLAILRILSDSGEHLTPLEIYNRVRQALPGITEATVYRTLSFLAGQGLVVPAHIGSGQFVYEFAAHDHHHLICRSCGEMRAIDHCSIEPLYRTFQETTGYKIDSLHLTFFGLCPDCGTDISTSTGMEKN